MIDSKIAIWNRALGFLGMRMVAAAGENTPEAVQCRLYWDAARRQALRDFPWNFAQERAWLAQLPVPQEYAQEYAHAYALPDGCLKMHEVRHEGRMPRPFRLARNAAGDGTMVLTCAARALGLFTRDVQDSRLFDDLFAHALSRKLAALVAVALLKAGSQKTEELEKLYAASLPPAREAAASEGCFCPPEDSWLSMR